MNIFVNITGRVTKNNNSFDINYDVIHTIDDIYDFNIESGFIKDLVRVLSSLYSSYVRLQQKGLGKPYNIILEKREKKNRTVINNPF